MTVSFEKSPTTEEKGGWGRVTVNFESVFSENIWYLEIEVTWEKSASYAGVFSVVTQPPPHNCGEGALRDDT